MLLRTVLLLALVVSSLGATHNVSVNESNQTAIDNATADVMFAPHTVGTVSNMTIMANLTMGRTIGDPMWTRWTYINLHYPAYTLMTDASGTTEFIGSGALASWKARFIEQDKAKSVISVQVQGVNNVTGPVAVKFTLTNILLPDNCEPMKLFMLKIFTAGDSPQNTFEAHATSTPALMGCQAAPVISIAGAMPVAWVENNGPLSLAASNITVTDSTPMPLPLKVEVKAKNGTVTVNATSVMGVEMEMEDDKVELMGMQASINAALALLVYTPEKDFAGIDTVTIEAKDHDGRGPGRAGVTEAHLNISMTPVDSIPSIMLGLDTPYVEARWRTATESPIKVADGDDKSGMNATVLVTVQSAMGKLWMTTNMNNMSQGNWSYTWTFNTTIADANKMLSTLKFLSDVEVTCAAVVTGNISVTVNNTSMGSASNAAVFPVYILSEGLVDGCGRTSMEWADFEPASALSGQEVSFILKGYKAWSKVSGGFAAALSYSDKCYLKQWASPVAKAESEGERLQVKLAVTEVGNFTLCYWSRGVDDISEWGSPNPLPMARKFEAYSNASVLPSSFMGGFTTCGEFIVNAMKMAMPPHNSTNSTNSTQPPPPMVPCGCMVVDNSTSTMALGTISLPLDYRADYLFQTDVSVTANMGCCTQNTPEMTMYSINPTRSWGYCSAPYVRD
jgi:hypothetical protein|eukprot:CAMPEP_0174287414 /NCGR_PEP_ID=MMETSP0809-20121228/15995_1 /TAXON_ID=73025 ORGANISM="Eutreptiella gymnastica-like, Strain CCMP1594" /NCGR_SAMPLE_ID=MMETSP0809 /ASSEMBLY_ACC=CAM_ASM_000658 /LENGTH=676 /DNA_ID=CAMNT_0015383971 /DNA_START=28 /DNA_END=2058 /DNA_ORIENTATION=+